MSLELVSQFINVFPLEGGFIKFRFCGNLIGYNLQFLTLKYSKCRGLNIPEWCVTCNAIIGKYLKQLPNLFHVLVDFSMTLVHSFFSYAFSFIYVASGVIDESVNEIIVYSLIAMVNKA